MKKLICTLVLLSALMFGTALAGSGNGNDADGGAIDQGVPFWLDAYLNSPIFFDIEDISLN